MQALNGISFMGLITSTALVVSNDAPTAVKVAARLAKVVFGDRIQICDGVDDHLEIQAAIDALPADGGNIVLLEGLYTLTDTVTITKSHVTVELSKGATVFLANNINKDMFFVYGTAGTPIADVEIHGGVFDFNKANNAVGDSYVIKTEYVNGLIVHHTTIKDSYDYTIYNNGGSSTGVYAHHCRFLDCGGVIYRGDLLSDSYLDRPFIGSYLTSMANCVLKEIEHGGIYLGSDQHATGNKMTFKVGTSATGINVEYIAPGPFATLKSVRVIGNVIDGVGTTSLLGIGITPNDNDLVVQGVVIIGNTIKNTIANRGIAIAAHPGITGATIDDIIIDDNVFESIGTYGISITINNQGVTPNHIFIGARNRFISCTTADVYPQGDNIEIEIDPIGELIREHPPTASTLVVGGTGTASGDDSLVLSTGSTANQTAYGGYRPNFSRYDYQANYDKRYIIEWGGARLYDVANALTYLKLDDDNDATDPNSKAIGFRIDNLAVKGIVHDGSALHVVDLATTVTSGVSYVFKCIHIPGVGVFWYIDGVYKGMSTDEPAGLQTNGEFDIMAITNGATAADARFYGNLMRIRRER